MAPGAQWGWDSERRPWDWKAPANVHELPPTCDGRTSSDQVEELLLRGRDVSSF